MVRHLLVVGFGLLGTLDHATNLWLVSGYIFLMGMGTGLLMQNLVLAVQNTVSVQHIGAASSSIAFFRTFGGAIGVSVLGAILASKVTELTTSGLTAMGIDAGTTSGSGNLDLSVLPGPIEELVRASYGDATGTIFLVAAGAAVITLIAVAFLPNKRLRTTIDLEPELDHEELKPARV